MDPLITGDELNEYLQRPVPADQAALAVAGASGIVRAHCRWTISREVAVTFTLGGVGGRVLGLPTLFMDAVHSVTVDGEPLDASSYYWDPTGQLYRTDGWTRWSKVEVVVDSGYVEIPDVVKIVALSIASRLVNNPGALKSATVGAVQRTYADPQLNRLELALLDVFRLA